MILYSFVFSFLLKFPLSVFLSFIYVYFLQSPVGESTLNTSPQNMDEISPSTPDLSSRIPPIPAPRRHVRPVPAPRRLAPNHIPVPAPRRRLLPSLDATIPPANPDSPPRIQMPTATPDDTYVIDSPNTSVSGSDVTTNRPVLHNHDAIAAERFVCFSVCTGDYL